MQSTQPGTDQPEVARSERLADAFAQALNGIVNEMKEPAAVGSGRSLMPTDHMVRVHAGVHPRWRQRLGAQIHPELATIYT